MDVHVRMQIHTDIAELILQELSTNIPPDNLIFFPSTIISLLLAFSKILVFMLSETSLAFLYDLGKPPIMTW